MCMCEAPLEMLRLPRRPQLASEDVCAIQPEQIARRTIPIQGCRAQDGGGLPRQSTIKVIDGSRALGCEDDIECRAQPFFGLRRQPTGNDRGIKSRDIGIEVVWDGQAEAPGQHLVIATCPDVAGCGAQE